MAIIFLLLILSSCTSLVLSAGQNDDSVLLEIKEQLGNPEFLSAWVDGFDFCNNHTDDPTIHVYVSCKCFLRKNQLWRCFLFNWFTQDSHMDLSYNQLAFDLSDVIIPEHLVSLDLSFNQIYGKVPKSIASAADQLQSLALKFNSHCGEIPQGGFMSRFNSYDQNRCLCGTPLPPCYNSAPAPSPSPLFATPFDSTP